MCVITKSFIDDVRYFFYEVNYNPDNGVKVGDYLEAVNTTTAHCHKDYLFNVMYNVDFCIKRWKKICKIFKRRADYYYSVELTGKRNIRKMRKELYEATDTLTLIDNRLYDCRCQQVLMRNGRRYQIDEEFEIKKHALYRNGERLFKMVNRDNMLKHNGTDFIVYRIDGDACIFRKEYILSLDEDDDLDLDQIVASAHSVVGDRAFEKMCTRIDYYQQVTDEEWSVIKSIAATEMIYKRDNMRSIRATRAYAVINMSRF